MCRVSGAPWCIDSSTSDDKYNNINERLAVVRDLKFCNRVPCSLPMVCISIGNAKLCAKLDTGGEISLVSIAALELFSSTCVSGYREGACV